MENAEALNAINIVRFGEAAVAGLELTLGVLLFMMSFLLLIACAKVANFRSDYPWGSVKEITAAAAFRSSSKRIVVQLLAESLLLGFVGGGVGLYAVWDGIRTSLAVFPVELSSMQFLGTSAETMFPMLIALLSATILLARRRILRIRRPHWNEARKGENQSPVGLPSAHPTIYRSRTSAYAP